MILKSCPCSMRIGILQVAIGAGNGKMNRRQPTAKPTVDVSDPDGFDLRIGGGIK